ncbi:hypothetical protein PI124_g2350 [Phytophthora idaei]|nr:hypothetical protein PI126_g2665 [Phytophthora idaei]KAG3253064.1 hypothetical protein PI124_g2350 [Phytophthora idaei]
MVDRYFKIYGKLDRVDGALVDVIRTARENVQLKSLYEDFEHAAIAKVMIPTDGEPRR